MARSKTEFVQDIAVLAEECDMAGHGQLCSALQMVVVGSQWPPQVCAMAINVGWLIIHTFNKLLVVPHKERM